MYTILTHPGSAHRDDFLSACVLLATLEEATVVRREPTLADLNDTSTFVVDVGMEYDPKRRNFDHHQNPSLPCAFHLIMMHLGLHEAANQVFVWYPHMSMMDVKGPYRAAQQLGVESSLLFATSSPVEGYILSFFAQAKSLGPDDLLFRFMTDLGRDMISLIEQKMTRLQRLKEEAQILPVKHYKALYSPICESPKLALELFLRDLDDERIVMSITPSNRGDGWELVRLKDAAAVDFRVITERPEVRFVHSTGFLAKTHTRLSLSQVLPLARAAIVNVPEALSA